MCARCAVCSSFFPTLSDPLLSDWSLRNLRNLRAFCSDFLLSAFHISWSLLSLHLPKFKLLPTVQHSNGPPIKKTLVLQYLSCALSAAAINSIRLKSVGFVFNWDIMGCRLGYFRLSSTFFTPSLLGTDGIIDSQKFLGNISQFSFDFWQLLAQISATM